MSPVGASVSEDLPERVTIYEVGPRDGLQNEDRVVETALKARFVERLVAAGLPAVELTSFVSPRWIPQLADADELVRLVGEHGDVPMPVLVPNQRGLDRALAAGAKELAVFASATETFARRNLNSTLAEQFDRFEPVMRVAQEHGMRVRAYLSMCFGDPWEGAVSEDVVMELGRRLLDMGAWQLSLGDTIGVATPHQVRNLVNAFARAGISTDLLAVHFHDTYGQALVNAYEALRLGVTTFDASAGGLGGCPYAQSSAGNLATEDLVWMLRGLGVETGVDLSQLVATSRWLADEIGMPSRSKVVEALQRSGPGAS